MKTLHKLIMLVLGALTVTLSATAKDSDATADAIVGVYDVTFGKDVSKVEIYRSADGCYSGRIIWLKNNLDAQGNPRCDEKNPDPELRKRHADQIVLLQDLKYNATDGRWDGGTIYNPLDGRTYDVMLEFESPVRLKVRGYLGKPMLGKTYYWTKQK